MAAHEGRARPARQGRHGQALARHSTISLTMDRYTHIGLDDITVAVESLPSLPAVAPRPLPGTAPTGLTAACTDLAQASDTGGIVGEGG